MRFSAICSSLVRCSTIASRWCLERSAFEAPCECAGVALRVFSKMILLMPQFVGTYGPQRGPGGQGLTAVPKFTIFNNQLTTDYSGNSRTVGEPVPWSSSVCYHVVSNGVLWAHHPRPAAPTETQSLIGSESDRLSTQGPFGRIAVDKFPRTNNDSTGPFGKV